MSQYIPQGAEFEFTGLAYTPADPVLFDFNSRGSGPVYLHVPGVVMSASSSWSKPTRQPDVEAKDAWVSADKKEIVSASGWGIGKVTEKVLVSGWSGVPDKESATALRWNAIDCKNTTSTTTWGQVPQKDSTEDLGWDGSIRPTGTGLRLTYNPRVAQKNRDTRVRQRRSNEYRPKVSAESLEVRYNPNDPLSFTFGGLLYTPSTDGSVYFHFFTPASPPGQIGPVDSAGGVRWGASRHLDFMRRLPWGWARVLDGKITGVTYPDYEGPVTIIREPPKEPELQEAYMIGNLVTVTEVVSELPIQAANINISYDADSFSWALTMDVLGKGSLNAIRPDVGGVKNVRIEVNGHQWVFLVEKYRRNFKFAQETYSVTGSSRTQLLTAPYAPLSSGVNTAEITARQIMDELLMNTGFVLEWGLMPDYDVPDWTIPAGAFSYQDQTPLQLIARISETAGAITYPGMAEDTITILPRYPAPVWAWSPENVHKILPSAIITSLGGEWAPNPTWDSCYVSGTNYGVSTLVRRQGTAGNKPAEDVFDDLITQTSIATYRGKVEISKGGDQELVTLQLPLFPEDNENAPGLVTPGMLCDVREEGTSWIGLCLSTSISCSGVGASVVTQSLRLERHTSEI